jgi:GTP-binding protein HflX
MATLRRRLADVARSRETQRERRVGSALPRVALAGYTNAGKSSLMNALADAGVQVNDALFETLDPTTRRVVAEGHELLLSDTVGFIRHLPHQLVNAFSSTLEEVREADLILHVADASEPESRREAQAAAVVKVLEEIGAGEIPRLPVMNKVDRLDDDARVALRGRHPEALCVSALTGEGLDDLRAALAVAARERLVRLDVTIPFALSGLVASVYADGREVEREDTESGTHVRALMPPAAAGRIRAAIAGAG